MMFYLAEMSGPLFNSYTYVSAKGKMNAQPDIPDTFHLRDIHSHERFFMS